MENKIEAVKKLRDALRAFSDETNNTAYRDKSDPEQDVEEIVNALYVHLDKLERHYKGEYTPPKRTTEEKLASKMADISQALRLGNIPIVTEVADEFMQALELFDLAREAKEKGKTAALKDKYGNI